MTGSDGQLISEADLFGVLRPELPDADAMAKRVRARLAEEQAKGASAVDHRPRGVVLRFADWTGLRGVAASIAGPVLLPLGLARAGTAGTFALKGLLPKSLFSALALPFALLMTMGLTLHLSLRRTTDLQGDKNVEEDVRVALANWWSRHRLAGVVFGGLLVLVNLASYSTAKVLLFLAGIVAHSLCAEALSDGRRASRQAITKAAYNIGWTIYIVGWLVVTASDSLSFLMGWEPERREFQQLVLDFAVTAWAVGLLTLASVQGRSRFMGPWRLLTKGSDLDIGKVVGAVLAVAATPGIAFALWFSLQSLEGSWGERIWASRASLAWFAFCLHALILVKRAPVVQEERTGV